MKRLQPTLHDESNLNKAAHVGNAAVGQVFKLGLDVDLRLVVVAIQCDHGAIQLAQKFTRARLIQWIKKQVGTGHTVHTVYEACGFGYSLHYALVAAGAHSIVTTPMRLNLERRRKNDRLDAQRMVRRSSIMERAIATLNHLKMVTLTHDAVRDRSAAATLVLAGARWILRAELTEELAIPSLLRSLDRRRISRPEHLICGQALGTLPVVEAGESRTDRMCGQPERTH
jgi:hypothetical protein